MAKKLTRNWAEKGTLAAVTVGAACFSLSGFASATSWQNHDWEQSKDNEYKSTYKWKDFRKNNNDDKKHGNKHSGKKHDSNRHNKHANNNVQSYDHSKHG